MKLLITGAGGFLGYHLKQEISKCPHIQPLYPTSKECNLLDYKNTYYYINFHKPGIILHAAAKCGGIGLNLRQPADLITQNMQMGLNIFEVAKETQIKYIYTLGSVCGYPHSPKTIPFIENELFDGLPEKTNMFYSESKRALLLMGLAYKSQYGVSGAHLIPTNLYGVKDNFSLDNSHVIPALIRKFYEAKLNNNTKVECWGSGLASREFLNAEDTSKAIIKAVLINLDEDIPINLGTGKEIIIKDLAELIAKLIGYTGEIVFNGAVSDGQPRRCLDVTRAKEILGWEAKIDLEDGLKETIKWYAENRETILKKEENDIHL